MKRKTDKPLITFALFVYNYEKFIREALAGAFSQTYSPLEIILSDDCSTDHTFEIIKEMTEAYRGPHSIIVNRNERNLGIGAHVNRIMELAQGELIVAAAGDDVSLPKRVEKIYQEWVSSEGKAKSIFSSIIVINEEGTKQRVEKISPFINEEFQPKRMVQRDFGVFGNSHAWSREVFDVFGPMQTPVICEDRVIPIRSALLGEIRYVDEPLTLHRRHGHNTFHYEGEDLSSVDALLTQRKEWFSELLAIYGNWLRDLEMFKTISPERQEEINFLQDIVNKRISSKKKEISFFEANYSKRIGILLKTLFEGTSFIEFRQRVGMYLMPSTYHKYLKLKHYLKN